MINRLLCLQLFILIAGSSIAQSFFTIVDDDAANIEAIASVKRLADKKGIKVSYAVCANKLLKDSAIVRVLLDYQNQGHHICNHSLTHNSAVWKNPQISDVRYEIERSEAVLDSLGFIHHNYLVYPYGKFSDTVYSWMIPLVSSTFNMAFESRGYSNDLSAMNRYCIARFPLRKHDNLFVVKRVIDNADVNGHWLVFLNHSGISRDYSEERLEEVIDYCQKKGMVSITIQEAWEKGFISLSENKRFSWTTCDEIIYFLYTHIGWLLLLSIFCAMIPILLWLKFHSVRRTTR